MNTHYTGVPAENVAYSNGVTGEKFNKGPLSGCRQGMEAMSRQPQSPGLGTVGHLSHQAGNLPSNQTFEVCRAGHLMEAVTLHLEL